jgi:hypothetical protein
VTAETPDTEDLQPEAPSPAARDHLDENDQAQYGLKNLQDVPNTN